MKQYCLAPTCKGAHIQTLLLFSIHPWDQDIGRYAGKQTGRQVDRWAEKTSARAREKDPLGVMLLLRPVPSDMRSANGTSKRRCKLRRVDSPTRNAASSSTDKSILFGGAPSRPCCCFGSGCETESSKLHGFPPFATCDVLAQTLHQGNASEQQHATVRQCTRELSLPGLTRALCRRQHVWRETAARICREAHCDAVCTPASPT